MLVLDGLLLPFLLGSSADVRIRRCLVGVQDGRVPSTIMAPMTGLWCLLLMSRNCELAGVLLGVSYYAVRLCRWGVGCLASWVEAVGLVVMIIVDVASGLLLAAVS